MGIFAYGQTDIGMVRKTNQDSIFVNNDKLLYIVADGMGGHKGGDIASQMAVSEIPTFFFEHQQTLGPVENLKNSILHGNKSIYDHSQENIQLKGMGTTVVSLYFNDRNCYIGNVGDSRAYLIQNKMIYQLSRDHSLVQEKINMGIYTREKAVNDQMKNVLIRTVGYEATVEVDVFTYEVNKYDLFMLCSDGLHGKVSDNDILHIINSNIQDAESATQDQIDNVVNLLIKQANLNGGQDNISVIMALAN